METDQWSRYLPAMMRFCQTRNQLNRLKIWAIIPKLDYVDANVCSQLIKLAPWRKIHIKGEGFDHLSMVPQLRHLQLQIEHVDQKGLNFIADSCPRLKILCLTSARVSPHETLDLSVLHRVEELALVDCELAGSIVSLPKRLRIFYATVRTVDACALADKFIDAICACRHLRKLHLASADSGFKTACFKVDSITRFISSLPNLEDLALDRDMFGRGSQLSTPTSPVAIVHAKLLSIKIFSTQTRNILPFVQYAPNLYAFEATDHFESLASIENIARYSLSLRSIKLKFDREQLRISEESQHQKSAGSSADSVLSPITPRRLVRCRSHSTISGSSPPNPHIRDIAPGRTRPLSAARSRNLAKVIGDCFKTLPSLIYVSLTGATEKVTNSLFKLRQLRKLHLNNCSVLTATLENLLRDLKTIRFVDVERCDLLDSVASLRSEKLASFRIASCPDLRGDVYFSGDCFPRLEIVDISNQNELSNVSFVDLPSLRLLTLQSIACAGPVCLDNVPNLNEVVLDGIACPKLSIQAPKLHRLFVDCDQTYDEECVGSGIAVSIKTKELRRISWNVDCAELDIFVPLLKTSPDLEVLDFPQVAMEDVSHLVSTLSMSCPLLRSIGCSDGDLQTNAATPGTK
eukprot:TRINITY_DN424_c0_g1_i2.p1 TRINITY_DN424_c0_g1~~TRINITY_DN424_c0_g1_i2.p1  ORF type:complete len:632 (-),score=72.03 TRINITY_DN424_c0_g1_i2:97-1992(-)